MRYSRMHIWYSWSLVKIFLDLDSININNCEKSSTFSKLFICAHDRNFYHVSCRSVNKCVPYLPYKFSYNSLKSSWIRILRRKGYFTHVLIIRKVWSMSCFLQQWIYASIPSAVDRWVPNWKTWSRQKSLRLSLYQEVAAIASIQISILIPEGEK